MDFCLSPFANLRWGRLADGRGWCQINVNEELLAPTWIPQTPNVAPDWVPVVIAGDLGMNDNFDDDSHDDNYGVDVDHTSGSHKYQMSCQMESL